MIKFSVTSALLCVALLLSACSSTNRPSGRDIGIVTGAILGGIAGKQMGDGGDINVVAGAVLGGALGGLAGNQVDERKEALEAAEAQRQYEYEQEALQQEKLEQQIEALEQKKVRDQIARTATSADVTAAEREAARIEAELAAKKQEYEASQARAKRIAKKSAPCGAPERDLELAVICRLLSSRRRHFSQPLRRPRRLSQYRFFRHILWQASRRRQAS
jgi:predicted small secreted protein